MILIRKIKKLEAVMRRKYFNKIFLTIVLVGFTSVAYAQTQSFDSWLVQTRQEALAQGISQATINATLYNIQPTMRAIELDKKQPEKKRTFAQYKKLIVDDFRISQGRKMLRKYARELQEVENQYGVPKEFIVALWGIETNYGSNTGGFKVVPALATLSWEGRRAEFFKKELMNALKIIDAGHISAANMKGSWAGAMGQNQFMPSSFNAYAVDGNGDGRRDIWGTKKDVFASTANYLKKNGWKTGERWGRRVTLPASFLDSMITPKIKKPISYWSSMGVRNYGGGPLPTADMMASIVAPDGKNGEAYIVYNNFQTIMDWNRSTYFATSVGLIADALSQ
jgi:membrane-bound lytic murein transglycosylase B